MKDPRPEYVRLLKRSIENFTPEPGEKREATLIGELADAGYVKGAALPDQFGVTRGAASWGMTVEGRLFLRRLEKELRDESLWSRLRRWGAPILAYVLGVATPVLSEWLKILFHVKP